MKYDVCVFGGCALDQIFYQRVDGTYNDRPDSYAPGGKGANQAVAASRAGAKTTIITRIGKDDIGKSILENLRFNLVDVANVEMLDGISNDYSNIYINIKDKDNDIKRFTGAIDSFDVDMIENYKHILLKSKIIVCQLKIPKEVTEALINFCYENNKMLILTPCRPEKLSISEPKNLELIDKISIITCNREECIKIFNTEDIESCVRKFPNKLIVTLGSEGLMYCNGKRIVKMPAIKGEVIDTTGAGDTLNGNLSAFLAKGLDLAHALRKASYASAMKISQKTAQAGMPYLEDLERFISNSRNRNFKYSKELNFALQLVKDAYDSVKYTTDFTIQTKTDDTLVTDLDLAIEKYMLNKINKEFPLDHFVTEENFPDNKLYNRTWVIDPIDGTIHFIKGDGLWGIQLAFYDIDTTKFSVIYLPEKDELYYAAENFGAYLNNNKILPREEVPINQSVIEFGGSIYKELDIKREYFNKLMDNNGRLSVYNVFHVNSSCISYTNLATRRTDALISATKNLWDILPGECLCRECGIQSYYLDFDKKVKLVTGNLGIKDKLFEQENEKGKKLRKS